MLYEVYHQLISYVFLFQFNKDEPQQIQLFKEGLVSCFYIDELLFGLLVYHIKNFSRKLSLISRILTIYPDGSQSALSVKLFSTKMNAIDVQGSFLLRK